MHKKASHKLWIVKVYVLKKRALGILANRPLRPCEKVSYDESSRSICTVFCNTWLEAIEAISWACAAIIA